MEQRAEDWYDLMDVILASRAGLLRRDDHIRLSREFCGLMSSVRVEQRSVQTHSMPSMRVQSARKAAKLAAGRMMVRGSMRSGSASSSSSDESAVEGKPDGRRNSRKKEWVTVRGDTR